MNLLEVDVDNALALLKQADEEVNTYLAHAKTAQALADTVATCWQGESGKQMQEQLEAWIRAQHASANKIRQNIVELRAALENLQNADTSLAARIGGNTDSHYSGGGRRG